jgi:hypothetical protein
MVSSPNRKKEVWELALDSYKRMVSSPSRKKEAQELGKALDSYMRFRAEKEGVGYELTPEFFETGILFGIHTFFGITVEDGELLVDRQRPKIFKQWTELLQGRTMKEPLH